MKTEHPAIEQHRSKRSEPVQSLDAEALRRLCLDAGADDAGLVEIERREVADQRQDILTAAPWARSLVSYVVRMNRGPIRSPSRSTANLEFHHTGDEVDEIGRRLVQALEKRGVRALNPAMGFPMDMEKFPGKAWVVSHKPVAVAAGLGHMGIHRNLIHPRFGNFVLLGTVITDVEVAEADEPVEWNPCLECKLCVAACPVGAIGADGHFDFSACYTHNYREFMSGFTNWTEQVVSSKDTAAYRAKVSDSESASMWQSLSYGANYKAAYCLAACPAGEDVIGPFLDDRRAFLKEVVKPLQEKEETVYAVPGSDAEAYVKKRFPHKKLKPVGNSLRPPTIRLFLEGLKLTFQRGRAEGLEACYHFTFTGEEAAEATVLIRDRTLAVVAGHRDKADLTLTADSRTWLDFLAKEQGLVGALLKRKFRLKGDPRLLARFAACFPS